MRTGSPVKRAAITRAALEVFLREGYARASVDAIAASAGVSKRTIYDYYGDKERLFLSTLRDTRDGHVASFREVSEGPADEAKRMLDFVAETAKDAGLEDYRVVVNVGEGAGQTVFHLHWHVLGGRVEELPG